MSIASIILFPSLLLASLACVVADARAEDQSDFSSVERLLCRMYGFFGIGSIPPMLATAVLASTTAIAGATLDVIAILHLGPAYPAWFPAVAAITGLGIGLLSTRLLARKPDEPEST